MALPQLPMFYSIEPRAEGLDDEVKMIAPVGYKLPEWLLAEGGTITDSLVNQKLQTHFCLPNKLPQPNGKITATNCFVNPKYVSRVSCGVHTAQMHEIFY